jgi:hypothetical protein
MMILFPKGYENARPVPDKGGKSKVTDGPFSESKQVERLFARLHLNYPEGADEWASRTPGKDNEMAVL